MIAAAKRIARRLLSPQSATPSSTRWHKRDRAGGSVPGTDTPGAAVEWAARRWGSAQTNRLNRAHWAGATGSTINSDLALYLAELRARCSYEAANNPFVEGVISTNCVDVVGNHGPTLQVESSDDAYNSALESAFREWQAEPTACGQLSFADVLRCWVRSEWVTGEQLSQMVTVKPIGGGVSLRLMELHADRLGDPYGYHIDGDVILGVRIDTVTGRPRSYYISKQHAFGPHVVDTGEFEEIDARYIVHDFARLEPGQARGVPLLSSALQTIADLRDYDEQTLDAARIAADLAILLTRDIDTDNVYEHLDVSVPIERRQLRTLPPGWKPTSINPPQPSTTYVQYRSERQRDIGRAANMPLMLVRLGSEQHSYASARFDAQVYQRSVGVRQSRLERPLNRCVAEIAGELQLMGELPPTPRDVRLIWTNWNRLPHVDRSKEAKADTETIESGRGTVAEATNRAAEETAMLLAREIATYRERGLIHPYELAVQRAMSGIAAAAGVGDPDDDETDGGDDGE